MPHPVLATAGRLLLMALLLLPARLLAQDTLRIAVGRSCGTCRVTMDHVVALGADAGVHGPSLESKVARDSRGRFFVGPTYTPGTVAVFGPDGRFQRAFGHQGSGPGEFPAVQQVVVGPGDSIWVSNAGGRVSVVSPDLQVVRSVDAGGTVEALIPLGGGRAVARVTREALRMLGPGDSVGSLVRLPEQDAMGSPFDDSMIRLKDGRLVVPQGSTYRLDIVREDGTHERAILRETTWFPQVATDEEANRIEQTGGRMGVIGHAAQAPDSRVWVLVYKADLSQLPALEEEMQRTGANEPSLGAVMRLISPVVELFDLETGQVVATGGSSQRFYSSFLDGEHLVGLRELDTGHMVLDIWRLGVREGRRAPTPAP